MLFRSNWRRAGHARPPKIGYSTVVYVDETDEKALAVARERAARAYEGLVPAALPSIVSGLLALGLFVYQFEFGQSIPSAGLTLALLIVLTSCVEWLRLLAGMRRPDLREEPPTWLPAHALAEQGGSLHAAGVATVALALARHWSGQDAVDRAQAGTASCPVDSPAMRILIDLPEVRRHVEWRQRSAAYVAATEGASSKDNPRCC